MDMEVPEKQTSSYRYWVRETTADAAPLPVPKKLSDGDLSKQPSQNPSLGSVWNNADLGSYPIPCVDTLKMAVLHNQINSFAGTWEEKSLSKWATDRIKELLKSVGSLEFSNGKAEVTDVSRCTGDAFLVTVRNKKRVGYTYEITIDVKGEWLVGGEKKKLKGHLDIAEFSYGELDDLEVTVKINEGKDLQQQDKQGISQDLKSFVQPLREKLLQFEQELRER